MSNTAHDPIIIRQLPSLDVREIFDFFLRRWKFGGTIAAFIFATFLVAAFTLPPSYTGVTQVLLDSPIDYMTPQDYSNTDFSDNPTFIESQIAVMRSASLLQQVVDSEKLKEDPKIGPAALTWLQGALGVSRVGLGNVIELDVTMYDRAKAASLANAVAQAYVTDRTKTRYEGVQKASAWLSDRAAYLRSELSRSEQAVEKFRADHNLLTTRAGSLTDQQLSELNIALINARAELSAKRAQYQQVDKLVSSGGDLQSMPDVLQSVVVSALRSQLSVVSRREADLRLKYGERHPEVLSAQAERRDIEGQISAEVQRLIGNLKNEVDGAEAREAALVRALGSVSDKSEVEGQVGIQLRDLERIATANQNLFETFLSRAKLTEEKSTLLNSGVRVITAAAAPVSPSFPNRPLFAALGLVLGVVFGGTGAVLRELSASGFMAKKQIEEELAVPVLASMPRMSGWSGDTQPIAYLERKPLSRYSEAVRRLRLGMEATSELSCSPRLILVTSAMPSEGKTTLALSLACSAAADGERVLLIDADLRLSAATAFFGMAGKVGLVDLLTLPMKAANAIHMHERSGISLLPAGAKTRNPPALLASARMRSILDELRGKFDTVIVDAPPVGPAADASILARHVDKIIFAVKWCETSREAVAEGIRHLGGRTKIAGIALTMVDEPKLPKYGRYTSLESSVSDSYYLN